MPPPAFSHEDGNAARSRTRACWTPKPPFRQIIFFLPLLILFPRIWGIDGVMYVGPVADTLAVVVAVVMLTREFRDLRKKEQETEGSAA